MKDFAQGKLLDQVQHLDTAMGISALRAIGVDFDDQKHDRHAILCPRGSCRIEVSLEGKGKPLRVDGTQVLWLPKGLSHSIRATSAIFDQMALFPNDSYFTDMIADNGLTADDRRLLSSEPLVLKRTKWLDDILERYFFERILNRHSPPGCTFFLEKQIVNEVARIVFRDKLQTWETNEGHEKDGVDAALRFIESNLFEKLTLEQIASVAKVSESSLLRFFKKDLGQTPYAYIKARRLDEAMRLLQGGEHTVGDIAVLVGYEDFSAFTKAFREKFGKPPTGFARSRG